MLGESNEGVVNSLQKSLDFRMETLQEVLMGQLSPFDRRLALFERRQNLMFARGDVLTSRSSKEESGQAETRQNNGETHSVEPASSVEIEAESPSEDSLRVANFLAEKHSDAETIALSSEDTVEVDQESGNSFLIDVTEVLEREFGEDRESETTASSAPSMSTAAAEKLS